MQYWITHPKLTPAHDQKIEAGALADYYGSGWQIREDQNDPDDTAAEPVDPREVVDTPDVEIDDEPVDPREPAVEPEPPASDPVPNTTKKKGEV